MNCISGATSVSLYVSLYISFTSNNNLSATLATFILKLALRSSGGRGWSLARAVSELHRHSSWLGTTGRCGLSKLFPELADKLWLQKLEFFGDLTSHLGKLNRSLQGSDNTVWESFKKISELFKLIILEDCEKHRIQFGFPSNFKIEKNNFRCLN